MCLNNKKKRQNVASLFKVPKLVFSQKEGLKNALISANYVNRADYNCRRSTRVPLCQLAI